MLRRIELLLKAWTVKSGLVEFITALPTTCWSNFIVAEITSNMATRAARTWLVERAIGGSGVAITAAVGDWNSSTASGKASSAVVARLPWLVALGKSWRSRSIILKAFGSEVAVLLEPEMAIYGAAFHELVMRADIDRAAAVEHHDQVAI